MSAKGFFYASVGIFLLVAACVLSSRNARADFASDGGEVVGFDEVRRVFLRSDGTLWTLASDGWHPSDPRPLPMPVSDILFWGMDYIITRDGHGWFFTSLALGGYVDMGPLPPPVPVSTTGKTWSGVKEGYRKR